MGISRLNIRRHISVVLYTWILQKFKISDSFWQDKSVLLVGPSSSVLEELEQLEISEFDLIVRMNRAVEIPLLYRDEEIRRIDVLFHSLTETGVRTAGRLTKSVIDSSGVKLLIPRLTDEWSVHKFLKKLILLRLQGCGVSFGALDEQHYQNLHVNLGKPPTTGLLALSYFMTIKGLKLTVVGLDFYRSGYMAGYNQVIETADDAIRWANAGHNPSGEFELAQKLMRDALSCGSELVISEVMKEKFEIRPR